MFQIGQLVVYGTEGVCEIQNVGALHLSGMDDARTYFTLCPVGRKVTIYVPTDRADQLRPVMTRQQAQGLIDQMPDIEPLHMPSNGPFMQRESYDTALHSHNCVDLVRILKTIYAKQHRHPHGRHSLGRIDEEYRRRAEDILFSEFAAALDMPREQIPSFLEHSILQAKKDCT